MIAATVAGNLGRDAEFKNIGSDGVCEFTVASSRKVKGNKETTWVRCTIWGKRGTALMPYLVKGASVVCVGELVLREYTKKDGSAGSSLELRVNDIKLMGGKGSGGAPRQAAAASSGGSSNYDDANYGTGSDEDPLPF